MKIYKKNSYRNKKNVCKCYEKETFIINFNFVYSLYLDAFFNKRKQSIESLLVSKRVRGQRKKFMKR